MGNQKSKPVKILDVIVIRCSGERYWYNKMVGKTLRVVETIYNGEKVYERLFDIPVRPNMWDYTRNTSGMYIIPGDVEITQELCIHQKASGECRFCEGGAEGRHTLSVGDE